MGKSMREKAVLAVVGVIVLYLVAIAVWFLSAESAWSRAAKSYRRAKTAYVEESRLIGEKSKWEDAYETEKAAMPTFAVGKTTDTTWQRKLDDLAERHHVFIPNAEAGAEKQVDEVLELPIDVKSWESSLEGLVKFLHELENTSEGMFDIARLSFKPNPGKKGYLRGSFTLNCAYMREK